MSYLDELMAESFGLRWNKPEDAVVIAARALLGAIVKKDGLFRGPRYSYRVAPLSMTPTDQRDYVADLRAAFEKFDKEKAREREDQRIEALARTKAETVVAQMVDKKCRKKK